MQGSEVRQQKQWSARLIEQGWKSGTGSSTNVCFPDGRDERLHVTDDRLSSDDEEQALINFDPRLTFLCSGLG